MKKTCLITGSGMDAKTLTHLLLSKDYNVYLATRRNTILEIDELKKIFCSDLKKYPNSTLNVLYVDICDSTSIRNCIETTLIKAGKIDEIYHLAASSLVSYSYEAPLLNIETNGISAFHFLENVRILTPKTRFYFAASTEMFAGNINDGKYTEDSKFYPKTTYGCSKILGFDLTRYFRETYNIFALSGILGNHSNTYRHPSFFIRRATQAAARISLGKQKELRIGHLEWARDEFFSDFGMEAVWKLLQLEQPEDVIIGNGKCRWGEEFVQYAFNYFNLKWQDYIVFDQQFLRKNEVVKLEVNPAKAERLIGWKKERMPFETHIGLMAKFDFELESGLSPVRPDVFALFP